MPTPPPFTRITLAPGDARRLHGPRGMRLVSQGGPVLVEQPAAPLFGGSLIVPAQRLCDGDTLVIERSGWLSLSAWAQTELICVPPPAGAWQRALEACRRFLFTTQLHDSGHRSTP